MTRRPAHRSLRRRLGLVLVTGGALASGLGSGTRPALAQTSIGVVQPPIPQVLLLLDSSGSMENWTNGQPVACGTTDHNVCTTTSVVSTDPTVARSAQNKWGSIISALSGSQIPKNSTSTTATTETFSWYEMPRTAGSAFVNEYSINLQPPYDIGYSLPYHRMVSWDSATNNYCVLSPGALPVGALSAAVGVGGPIIAARTTDSPDAYNFSTMLSQLTPDSIALANGAMNTSPSSKPLDNCTFTLNPDGNIDAVRDLVRFGLMTFDNDVDPGTGITASAAGLNVNAIAPTTGLWSYFPGWNTPVANWTAFPGVCASDQGAGCLSTTILPGPPIVPAIPYSTRGSPSLACGFYSPFEVGCRNPAAPPWEGRMVQFPDGRAPLSAQEATNDEIKMVLAATRPYGATPIAGMLADARNYFRYDPNGPEQTDPFVNSPVGGSHGCRDQYIILLTDGGANLDLQPTCGQGSPSTCPYEPPEVVTKDLCYGGAGGTGACVSSSTWDAVTTYVIGFSFAPFPAKPPATGNTTCQQMVTTAGSSICTGGSPCSTDPYSGYGTDVGSDAQACCNLIKMACNGSGGPPLFADTAADLNSAFATILKNVTRQSSSHVVPVFATAYGNGSSFEQESFTASYNTGNFETSTTTVATPWAGSLVRNTTDCKGNVTSIDLGQELTSQPRQFLLTTTKGSTPIDGSSLRPYLSKADGLSSSVATEYLVGKGAVAPSTALQTARDYQILTGYDCPADPNSGARLYQDDCARYAGDFFSGNTIPTGGDIQGPTGSSTYTPVDRSATSPPTLLGPIINSVPAYVSAPSLALSDTTYRAFADLYKTRPNVLYVESTDGALHALNPDWQKAGDVGEFFTFLPPADNSLLVANIPGADKTLLDGTPVVADTVWQRSASSVQDWHTTLVSSFGGGGRGYFALDVTNPAPSGWAAATGSTSYSPAGAGPHFLWQLTTEAATATTTGIELFGANGATPAITTLSVSDGTTTNETGVAILPGGFDGVGPTGTCKRSTATSDAPSLSSGKATAETADYDRASYANAAAKLAAARTYVRSWSALPPSSTAIDCASRVAVTGRSVSIVRLSDGFIIATFVNPTDNLKLPGTVSGGTQRLLTTFDAPMTGTPVTYPAGGGRIAQYAYVSDADGMIWKLDLHATNPAAWTSTLFFDSMNQIALNGSGVAINTSDEADVSEPLTGPPILSVGPDSSLVLNFATGDQNLFTTAAFKAGSADKVTDERTGGNVDYVWSVSDTLPGGGTNPHWYVPFDQASQYNDPPAISGYMTGANNNFGERVTGPMTVFDGVLYFATLKPTDTSKLACQKSESRIYGMDYFTLDTSSKPASGAPAGKCTIGGTLPIGCGGERRLLTPAGGQYNVPGASDPTIYGALIPGVAVTELQSCTTTSPVGADTYFGNAGGASYVSPQGPQTPTLSYVTTRKTGSTDPTKATTAVPLSMSILPSIMTTKVDSWASVIN